MDGLIPFAKLKEKAGFDAKLSDFTGVMSDAEKAALWGRINSVKTTMDAVAVAGAQYYLGEQSAVAVTLPSTASAGQTVGVVFYSGATAATLTVTGTTIGTIPTPAANQRIELNMLYDGTYWAVLSNAMAVSA